MPLTNKLAEWETLSKIACVLSVPDNRENIGNPFNNVFRYLMLFKLHGGIRASEKNTHLPRVGHPLGAKCW